jgi:ribosomal protein S27E
MEEEVKLSTTNQAEVTCKNCAAKLTFAPGTTSLKCEYCGAENEIEVKNDAVQEIDFEAFINEKYSSVQKQEISTVRCEGCGAQTTFDPNVVSELCAFCGSVLVVKDPTSQSIVRPGSLLPFKIDTNKAFGQFQTWLNKLWFAPSDLKKFATQQEKLKGMYIPYWTYDSNTYSRYTGERGDDYQATETYTTTENGQSVTKTRTVTKTRWHSVSGNVNNVFDDVLVLASKSLPKGHTDKLEPWDLEELINYDEKFLSGFRTETYQVDMKDSFTEAKVKMEPVIRDTVNHDIGGDHQRISTLSTTYNDITFKHILLPIWISAYRYNEKIYRFLVNGRTGEVQGERPWSWIKISLAILAGLAIIGGAIWLYNIYGK